MTGKKYTDERRILEFWNKVDRSGGNDACWLWIAARTDYGYGKFRWKGKAQRANRIAYEIANGAPPEALFVLHTCDNPACVNPRHLFLGTHQDNMDDQNRKGRTLKGEHHGSHKLSDAQVEEIRRLYSGGTVSQRELSRMFGVCQTRISQIVRFTY